ncbi:MAG: hypothetical protein K5694_02150 [Bacilli bacterium]|nr:hypothetical protein [Bacilli bacterium]
MSLKEKWKTAGKNIGGAFGQLGRAIGTTAKTVVGKEEEHEEGQNPTKTAWKEVGHRFGDAGKALGKAAVGTVDKLDEETKDPEPDPKKEAVEAEAKPVDEGTEDK